MYNGPLLDKQLAAGLRGDFKTGWNIAKKLEKQTPNCPAAAFNRGWYELRNGNLLKGHQLLDAGRGINVFGNRHIGTKKPIWNKQCGMTVLLNLEGGLGDQIHGVRFAHNLADDYSCRVIIACSSGLEPVLQQVAGVSAVVCHEAATGVHCDYWLPSMSAVVALGLEYDDLDGSPYIPRTADSKGKTGIRWVGNPEFEHQQHRLFPADLMFDAVKGQELISLQKDTDIPNWLNQPNLTTWTDTQAAISTCDRVISSCTSVAHLAAAMGIETWIVIPILSYYLWAVPSNKTAYYDSVTLFRQTEYENWSTPFTEIKNRLNN